MKRQKETIGSILEIDLKNGHYSYAQILKNGVAFFDYLTNEPLKEVNVLENRQILFILGVYKDVITQGHWLKIGKLPIRKDLEILPMQFIQDGLSPNQFSLYNPNTGEILPTTKEQCKGLERCSVWDRHHVEDRIQNYFDGVPCLWLMSDYKLWEEVDKIQWLIEKHDLKHIKIN